MKSTKRNKKELVWGTNYYDQAWIEGFPEDVNIFELNCNKVNIPDDVTVRLKAINYDHMILAVMNALLERHGISFDLQIHYKDPFTRYGTATTLSR